MHDGWSQVLSDDDNVDNDDKPNRLRDNLIFYVQKK